MLSLTTISGWLANWNALYSGSRLIATTVTAIHLLSLLIAGGLAIAMDRITLRASDADASRVVEDVRATHPPVLAALAVLFGSGVLLAAADIETFLASPVFWVKLTLVALLLVNGVGLARTEARHRRDASPSPALWTRLRIHAGISLMLWVAITVAGTALVNFA